MAGLELLVEVVEVDDGLVVAGLHLLVRVLLEEEEVEDGVALVCEHGLREGVVDPDVVVVLQGLGVLAEVHEGEVLSGDVELLGEADDVEEGAGGQQQPQQDGH